MLPAYLAVKAALVKKSTKAGEGQWFNEVSSSVDFRHPSCLVHFGSEQSGNSYDRQNHGTRGCVDTMETVVPLCGVARFASFVTDEDNVA